MTERLSPMQRDILKAMAREGDATFTGRGARRHGYAEIPVATGLCIRAYSSPQFFLARRGLIKAVRLGDKYHWYRITPAGRQAIRPPLIKAAGTQ